MNEYLIAFVIWVKMVHVEYGPWSGLLPDIVGQISGEGDYCGSTEK